MPMIINTTMHSDVQGIQISDELVSKIFEGDPAPIAVRKPGELIKNLMTLLVSQKDSVPLEQAWQYVHLHIEDID